MYLVALGANRPSAAGAPRETLEAALAELSRRGARTLARSRWYWSSAFPPGSGPDYANGAATLAGPPEPEAMLALLHEVEAGLGRTRTLRWEPRVCDLDLLAAGDAVRPDAAQARAWMEDAAAAAGGAPPPGLVLPHPRLRERAFVLLPLAEIAPGWRHPLTGETVLEMLAALPEAACAEVIPIGD